MIKFRRWHADARAGTPAYGSPDRALWAAKTAKPAMRAAIARPTAARRTRGALQFTADRRPGARAGLIWRTAARTGKRRRARRADMPQAVSPRRPMLLRRGRSTARSGLARGGRSAVTGWGRRGSAIAARSDCMMPSCFDRGDLNCPRHRSDLHALGVYFAWARWGGGASPGCPDRHGRPTGPVSRPERRASPPPPSAPPRSFGPDRRRFRPGSLCVRAVGDSPRWPKAGVSIAQLRSCSRHCGWLLKRPRTRHTCLLWIMGPANAADGTVRRPTGDFATVADDVSAAIETFDRVIDRLVRRAARAADLEPDGAARLETAAREAIALARIGLRHRPGDVEAAGRGRSRSPRRGRALRPREQPRPDGGSPSGAQG